MAKLEITLSRAHKIAERLKTKASEMSAESEKLAASVHVSGKTGTAQIERIAAQGAQSMALSKDAERVLRAVASVRQSIAHENEKRGINRLLALGDAVNRIIGQRKSQLESAKDGSIGHGELAQYEPIKEDSYGRGMVHVNVFTDAQRATMAEDLAKLQKESFAIADEVAEANAARFTLHLDDDIAQMATGS